MTKYNVYLPTRRVVEDGEAAAETVLLPVGVYEASTPQGAALAAAEDKGTPGEHGATFVSVPSRYVTSVPIERTVEPRFSIAPSRVEPEPAP